MKNEKIIITDLEMTCWDNEEERNGQPREIIEIGIIEVDTKDLSISRKRQLFIKPKFSDISNYCTQLTGITHKKSKSHGLDFPKACRILESKYGTKNKLIFGWGEDNFALQQCSELHGVDNPISGNYVNLSAVYSLFNKTNEKINLKKACELEGIEWEGQEHSGLDDALNTAKLLIKMIEKYNI